MAYDPVGAANGLFAPAYIPGNQQAMDAATAWNAKHQAQLDAARAARTVPAAPPSSPMASGSGFLRPGMGLGTSWMPPAMQALYARAGLAAPAQSTSSTFSTPAQSSAGQLPFAAPPGTRDAIAQTLMQRNGS